METFLFQQSIILIDSEFKRQINFDLVDLHDYNYNIKLQRVIYYVTLYNNNNLKSDGSIKREIIIIKRPKRSSRQRRQLRQSISLVPKAAEKRRNFPIDQADTIRWFVELRS